MKEDDANVVKSILAGNLDDFRKLWDKYQLDAKKWAFHYVRNSFEAERLETVSQGVNFALTLIEMATEGIKQKTNKWD